MTRSAMAAVPPVTPAAKPMLVPADMKRKCGETFRYGQFRLGSRVSIIYDLPIKTGTAANPPVAMVKAPPSKVRPPATTPVPEPMAFAMVPFFVTLATRDTNVINSI